MSRYTFRVRNRGGERSLGITAFYGEVGWDEELATFYARVWREAPEEALTPADYEPLVSCGGRLCEVTDMAKLERCLAERSEVDFDPAEFAGQWNETLEADRDRYMESLSVEQEMNLLFRLRWRQTRSRSRLDRRKYGPQHEPRRVAPSLLAIGSEAHQPPRASDRRWTAGSQSRKPR